jgi:nitrogen-specific signal transduction histidine kinase
MSFDLRVLAISVVKQNMDWLFEHEDALAALHVSIDFSANLSLQDASGCTIILLDSSVGLDSIHTLLADSLLLTPAIPVLLGVFESELTELEHLLRYGAQDFVLKNVDTPATIRRCIVNAIDRSAVLRASEIAEAQIRTLVESLSDGILILDKRCFVLYGNPMVEQLLGQPLGELFGLQTPFQLTGKEHEYLFWQRPTGPPVTLSVHACPMTWDGLDAHLLTLRDVTSEQASYEMLKLAKKTAEKAGAMKSTFLAHMSHELRLPLASIIGFAQLLEEGVTDPDFKEFASLIEESGQRLLETINSVLEAARLEQHTLIPSIFRIDAAGLIPSVIKRLQPLVRQSGVVISFDGPPSLNVKCDRNFLERVLTNLVGNAAKFTNEGRIHISWEASDTEAIINVVDTGIGIEPTFLKEAFEPFSQESSGSIRTHEGTDLGLSISKKLVESMGGTISVQSVKNEGTTFTFTLPLAS